MLRPPFFLPIVPTDYRARLAGAGAATGEKRLIFT